MDDELDFDNILLFEDILRLEDLSEDCDFDLLLKYGWDLNNYMLDLRLEILLFKFEYVKNMREKVYWLKLKIEFENYRLKIIGIFNVVIMEMSWLIREWKYYEVERVVKEIM